MGSEIKMLYFLFSLNLLRFVFHWCRLHRVQEEALYLLHWHMMRSQSRSGLTVSCLLYIPVQMLFQEHSFSLCSRCRFYKILPLFLRLLTNTCLITISTVPFPTSKCLLLPLLQLHFAMSYCERGTEATAHNIWQLYSCCAEKHPSHSKLQP